MESVGAHYIGGVHYKEIDVETGKSSNKRVTAGDRASAFLLKCLVENAYGTC
jgi:hypothetical protein